MITGDFRDKGEGLSLRNRTARNLMSEKRLRNEMVEDKLVVPISTKEYAKDEDGRKVLKITANSVEFANSLNPSCWATLVSENRPDWRLFVGPSIMLLLRAPAMGVEITVISAQLDEDVQKKIRNQRVGEPYKRPEGGSRYRLDLGQFLELWPKIRESHRDAIRQVADRIRLRTQRSPEHCPAAISFLNDTLSRTLVQPEYVEQDDKATVETPPQRATAGFARLTQSLRDEGLLFSREVVANYVLALQTKRFAILTGISGTGKTRIAIALAQQFPPVRHRKLATSPDDAFDIKVMPSQIKYSRIMLPAPIRANLSLLPASADLASRQLRIRYPAGQTTLAYNRSEGGATALLFRGKFRDWFHGNLAEGDRFWLRLHAGDTVEHDELEIGLAEETKVIEELGDNYLVVPVRPDWVDNRGLLGYFNPLTDEYSTTPFLDLLIRAQSEKERADSVGEDPHPFFLILDEMNLARVEHYFSDFLSAVESGEPIPLHENEAVETGEAGPQIPRQLKVPVNVFFTGTVNVDETTYMFSPKVLDRAFTIEFDHVDLEGFTQGETHAGQSELDLDPETSLRSKYRAPGRQDWVEFSKDAETHHKALLQLHKILQTEHRHFGYRVANEIARFVNLAKKQTKNTDRAVRAAFDLALLQKVLPKFHGTKQELEPILGRFFNFAVYGSNHSAKGDQHPELKDWRVVEGRLTTRTRSQPTSGDASPENVNTTPEPEQEPSAGGELPIFPRTGAKIWRMLDRLQKRGFTSFIE